MRRDPIDQRRTRRLAGSYLASVILHALAALLLLSVATSSSEQFAPESVQGNQIVSVTTQTIARPIPAVVPKAAPPVPHAPVLASPRARPQRAAKSHPRILHELAKFAPTAPPNPTPAPVASSVPNPQPTQETVVPTALPFAPAAPTSVPTAAAVAVAIKVPPTAVPSAAPTAAPTLAPTAKPRPIPTSMPTHAPSTPVPAQPTAAPATAAPVVVARVEPKPSPGQPSPGPTALPTANPQHGTAQTPGPKPAASAGPKGTSLAPKTQAAPKPVQVPATPAPARPPAKGPGKKPYPDINARLRSLIPTGPVTPTTGTYHADLSRMGGRLEPTPPPEVLAQTKYLFEESGKNAGLEGRIKMYVTAVHKIGPVTMCTGWLLRYPRPDRQYGSIGDRQLATGRVDLSGAGFGSPRTDYTVHPIIEQNVTYACSARSLTPFVAPSPSP